MPLGMSQPRSSRRCALGAACLLLGLLVAEASPAEPLGVDPSLSLTSQYESNPFAEPSGGRAAGVGAVIAGIPLTYTGDAQSFDLKTGFRFARTIGDTQLLTDYQDVNADWRLNTELNSVSASLGVHRDTTFYDTYENAQLRGHSLPRLDETAGLGWQHSLDERSHVGLSASYDQENFSEQSGLRLQSFYYAQGAASYDRTLSERWTSSTSVGYGRYDLRDLGSINNTRFAQTSLSGPLDERWSASAQVGYSRVSSSSTAYLLIAVLPLADGQSVDVYTPIHVSSSIGVTSYSVNLSRAGEGWSASLSAARTVQPSVVGQLLAQESVTLSIDRPWNERLKFGGSLRESEQSDPLVRAGAVGGSRYYAAEAHVNWQWTEHWSLSVTAGYNEQRLGGEAADGHNVSASLMIERQFDRIPL